MRSLVLGLLVLLAMPPHISSADGFDEPPDTTTKGGVQARTWTPYVAAFYVAPPPAKGAAPTDGAAAAPAVRVAPGLWEGWVALQRDAYIRRGEIAPTEPVISGWRVDTTTENKGLGFQVHATSGMRDPILSLPLDAYADLRLEIDVILPVSDDAKQKMFLEDKLFQVDERSVTLHRVSDDPMNTRAKAEDQPMEGSMRVIEREKSYPMRLAGIAAPISVGSWPLRTPGVYEFRVKARIRGRLNKQERAEVKDVEGAIRVAVSGTSLEIGKLNFEGTHKYRYYRRKTSGN